MSYNQHATEHLKANLTVFVALIFLTILTVFMAKINLGKWSIAIALGLASTKASLVLLWFMHLKEENMFNRVVAVSGFFFLLLFYSITAADVFLR